MNCSIAQTISRLVAPRHELSCSWLLWWRLWFGLRSRGEGRQESGAFLLGREDSGGRRRIVDFVLYDDLDPQCLSTGIVRFDGRYFGELWATCRKRGLSVVADIHTHPGRTLQSPSDQAHPMISVAGHIALIAPRFALGTPVRSGLGVYRYQGHGRWCDVQDNQVRSFFHIGL